MLVTSLTPEETLGWFNTVDRQHEILCCMITANPNHREVLKEIVKNRIDADATLGRRVAFVLFGGTKPQDFHDLGVENGARRFVPGEFLPLRDMTEKFEQHPGRKNAGLFNVQTEMLTRETAKVADQWMELLGVDRASLPVLCAFVKGADAVVIPLASDISSATVLAILGRLADIAQRDSERIVRVSLDAEARVSRAISLESEYAKLRSSLAQPLEAICNRYRVDTRGRQIMAQFIAAEDYTEEALNHLFEELGLTNREDFETNSTVRGARSKIRKISDVMAAFEMNRPDDSIITPISEALADLEKRRAETLELVQQLKAKGIDARAVDKKSIGVRYDAITERAAQGASLVEKVAKLVKGIGLLVLT